jgi:hypothetical protein
MSIKENIKKEINDYKDAVKENLTDEELKQIDEFISNHLNAFHEAFEFIDALPDKKDILGEMHQMIKDYLEEE